MSMTRLSGTDFVTLVNSIFNAMSEAESETDATKSKTTENEEPSTSEVNNPCDNCQYHPCYGCDDNCGDCSYNDEPSILDCIKKVIFQDDYTIIFWNDGSKTSVKCNKEDTYDPEKGLAMALLKELIGNKYYRDMQKIIEKYPHIKSKDVKKKASKKTKTTKRVVKKSEDKTETSEK